MTLVVAVVAVVVAIASYLTWTAGRLDRLAARVEAAWASLDAQLVRRAAAAAELAAHARRHATLDEVLAKTLEDAALVARDAAPADREAAENELTRRVRAAVAGATLRGKGARLVADVDAASAKVTLARQFFNDAVRDNRAIRRRWLPRLLAARHAEQRAFFEIEDPGPIGGSSAVT